MVKRVGKYDMGKTLGSGTFGKVKFAINTETGERVAIKVLDKEKIQRQNMGAQIKKEISIMKMVRHRNVVTLREVLASRTKIFIVLELVTGGELFDKIVAEGRFNEETARFYFHQLVDGVEYCHAQGVCHRDLKPENLLLDESLNLKVSDFGLSALYTGTEESESGTTLLHTTCGTPNYVAPEVLEDKGYDGRAADVWSIGVILYVLLAGFLPFDEPTMSALFRKIQKAEFTYPAWFTPEVRDLLDRILVADPRRRISLPEVKTHPWFTAGKTPGSETARRASGGAVMLSPPSAEDVRHAVEEGVAVEEDSKEADGPKTMTAFDIINMCGGTALNRMLSTRAETRATRQTLFTSAVPSREILQRLRAAVEAEHGARIVRYDERTLKLKAMVETSKSTVGIVAQVYLLTTKDPLSVVEVRRGQGDILEFYALYRSLQPRIEELVFTGTGK